MDLLPAIMSRCVALLAHLGRTLGRNRLRAQAVQPDHPQRGFLCVAPNCLCIHRLTLPATLERLEICDARRARATRARVNRMKFPTPIRGTDQR
jgi:hypothetical protein